MIRSFLNLVKNINKLFNFTINKFILKYYNVRHGRNLKINGRIYIKSNGRLNIGDNCTINSGKNINTIGGDAITRFIVKENAILNISNNVGISNSTIYCANKICIEEYAMIGGGCKIWDTDFHSLDPAIRLFKGDKKVNTKPIVIKRGAFIGGSSIVLKGVTIGENSVVGAGSIVTKDIPDNEIWAGNPAKLIRKLDR